MSRASGLIADDIGRALEREWNHGEAELLSMYRNFRAVLGLGVALVVVLGIVLSVATFRRLVRLEGQGRALSAQLVTAQEQERRAIARELHDEVGQALSGLLLEVGRTASITDSIGVREGLDSRFLSEKCNCG